MALPKALETVANLTANFVLSLYPINQLAKLVHLAPKYHDSSGDHLLHDRETNRRLDHHQPNMSSTTDNLVTNIAKRRLAARNAANPKPTRNRLPPVTRSDLININQIHAASLNGLAGQFQAAQPQSPATPPLVNKNAIDTLISQPAAGEQQNRKASHSNSVSQFAVPPLLQQPPPPTGSQPQAVDPMNALLQPPGGLNQPVSTQQPPPFRFKPTGNSAPTGGPSGMQMFTSNAVSSGLAPPASQATGNQRQQPQTSAPTNGNKFTFLPASSSQLPNGFDSTPLATTNSVSVHQQQQQQPSGQASQPISSVLSNNIASGGGLLTSTSTMASAAAPSLSQGGHQHHHHHHQPSGISGGGQSVLASFSPPVRAHNTFGGPKYSLDGIIAVAIFGGFIFLGAIITIIVIIIRR